MTIECYFRPCKYHGLDGPFCYELECRASPEELRKYETQKRLEDQGYNLAELDKDNPFNQFLYENGGSDENDQGQ